ncbi:hypothetical protein ACS5NO_02860 [Larkinella sp. GY13]|uniref:hypothetical protein n=1 Tax=Larkinella sp. GY13 TaxID=3453720 RepID=UPI003EE8D871
MNSTHTAPIEVINAFQSIYSELLTIVEEAWAIYQERESLTSGKLPGYKAKRRSIGSDMSDILNALFKTHEIEGTKVLPGQNTWYLSIQDRFILRFNMMDRHGNTFKTITDQYRSFRSCQLPIEGMEPEEMLFAGYVPDKSMTELVNFFILKRDKDDHPIWRMDKNDFIHQGVIPFSQPARAVEPEETQRPKRATAKQGLGRQNQPKTGS